MNASTFGQFKAGRASRRTAASLALALVLVGSALAETTFTFQGRLGSAGAPATGPHDFEFRLFDAATGGTQISGDLARDTVDVTDGIFTIQLDFGDAPFNSSPRWLEIDVRESGSGAHNTLDPRQRIGASPFAIETLFVAPGAVDTEALQDGAVTTAKIANGAVDSAQVANQSIAAIDLASGSVGSDEIIDGTITPADVSGGLYARKGHVYLRESNVLVGFGKTDASASCDDANDLLMIAVCNPDSPNNDLRLLQRRLTNIDNDVLPVGLRCQMENDNPTVPQRFSATVGCVAVP